MNLRVDSYRKEDLSKVRSETNSEIFFLDQENEAATCCTPFL